MGPPPPFAPLLRFVLLYLVPSQRKRVHAPSVCVCVRIVFAGRLVVAGSSCKSRVARKGCWWSGQEKGRRMQTKPSARDPGSAQRGQENAPGHRAGLLPSQGAGLSGGSSPPLTTHGALRGARWLVALPKPALPSPLKQSPPPSLLPIRRTVALKGFQPRFKGLNSTESGWKGGGG